MMSYILDETTEGMEAAVMEVAAVDTAAAVVDMVAAAVVATEAAGKRDLFQVDICTIAQQQRYLTIAYCSSTYTYCGFLVWSPYWLVSDP
jgi:hypothetical protein